MKYEIRKTKYEIWRETPENIRDRAFRFSLSVIDLARHLVKDPIGRRLGDQVLRSATSIGANIEEAHSCETRKDFTRGMTIAKKEARETLYWLRLISEANFSSNGIKSLIDESEQILKILGAIVRNCLKAALFFWAPKVFVFTLFFVFRISNFVFADLGTTSGQFLELPVSARAIAMGSAQGALGRDATTLRYNPANLGTLRGGNVVLMYAGYFEDSSYQNAAVSQSMGRFGTLALGFQNMTHGSFEEVDNTGQILGTSFKPSDQSLGLGYGKSFGKFDAGIGAKRVSSKIKQSADTLAYDAGVRVWVRKAALSVSATNLGGGLKYVQKEDDLPQTFRLGSAINFGRWISTLDVVLPKSAEPFAAVGTEYNFIRAKHTFSLRAGFNTRNADSDLGGITGLSAGLGLSLKRFFIDYAFSPYGDLGDLHRASIGFEWGPMERKQRPAKRPKRPQQTKAVVPVPPKKDPAKVTPRRHLAVADLHSRNVADVEAGVASDMIRSEFVESGDFIVIDRRSTQAILAEQAFQSSGCTTEDCAVKVGKLLNAQIMVVGTVARVEKTYYLNVSAVDVETGRIMSTEWAEASSPNRLATEARNLGRRLAGVVAGQ